MAAKEIWYAQEGSVEIAGTDFSADVKEISVTGGVAEVDLVRTFGNNQIFDNKPHETVEVALTTVKKDIDFAIMAWGGSNLAGTGIGSAFEDNDNVRPVRTIKYTWTDTSDVSGAQIKITMASAFATSREMTLNTEDHIEETVTFKCLPKNYREIYTDDRADAGSIAHF